MKDTLDKTSGRKHFFSRLNLLETTQNEKEIRICLNGQAFAYIHRALSLIPSATKRKYHRAVSKLQLFNCMQTCTF